MSNNNLSPAMIADLARLAARPDLALEAEPATFGLVRRGLAVVVAVPGRLDPQITEMRAFVRLTAAGLALAA